MNRRQFIKGALLTSLVASTGISIGRKLLANKPISKTSTAERWLLNTGKPHLGSTLTRRIKDTLPFI